jgi:hypothetical protein
LKRMKKNKAKGKNQIVPCRTRVGYLFERLFSLSLKKSHSTWRYNDKKAKSLSRISLLLNNR